MPRRISFDKKEDNNEILKDEIKVENKESIEEQAMREMEEAEKIKKERKKEIEEEKRKKENEKKEMIRRIEEMKELESLEENEFDFDDEDTNIKQSKKVFINYIKENKSLFKEGIKNIGFQGKEISGIVLESSFIKTINKKETRIDDTLSLEYALSNKLFKIKKGTNIYDNLSFVKGNYFSYYREEDIQEKDCDACFGSGKVQCGVCNGEKKVICEVCNGDGEIQRKEYEKRLVEKGNCHFCGGTKKRGCPQCNGHGMIQNKCGTCGGAGVINGQSCQFCGGTGSTRVKCGTCGGTGMTRCNECSDSGKILIEENEPVFKTTRCHNCEGTGKLDCNHCYGEGELTCEKCNGEGKLKAYIRIDQEFDIEKEDFFSSSINEFGINNVKDMSGKKIKIPLEDSTKKEFIIGTKNEELYHDFIDSYNSNSSKKKSIVGKEIVYILGVYSYMGKKYKMIIHRGVIMNIELPETKTGKIIQNIVGTSFIIGGVMKNLINKKKKKKLNISKEIDNMK